MKPQDIFFLVLSLTLIILHRDRWFLYAGLTSWIIAIPLFAKWVFFTAERLTWYGAAWIFMYTLYAMYHYHKSFRREKV